MAANVTCLIVEKDAIRERYAYNLINFTALWFSLISCIRSDYPSMIIVV